MTQNFSVKATTRRWPMQVLSNMLNSVHASINAWILFKQANKSKISRQKCSTMLIEYINELINQTIVGDSNMTQRTSRILEITSRISTSQPPKTKKRRLIFSNENATPVSTKYCQIRLCNNNKCLIYVSCKKCHQSLCGKCLSEKRSPIIAKISINFKIILYTFNILMVC